MPSFLLITALFCFGCASPGPPKPPSLRLPQPVQDLSAQRVGDRVVLRWTTPSRTTDDLEIKGSMTAVLCRDTGTAPATRPSASAAKVAVCAPVLRLPVVPGTSEAADALPPALQSGPAVLLAYRIQILNSTGHSAGSTATPAFAAAGPAPAPIATLRATASEQGAILEWQMSSGPGTGAADLVDLRRIDLSAPPPSEREPKPAAAQPHTRNTGKARSSPSRRSTTESPNEIHLRSPDTASSTKPDTAGTVDTTAAMGETYSYTAQRVRIVNLGGRDLEVASLPSSAVTLTMRDTFPPKPPAGLATITGTVAPDSKVADAQPQPYVDLSWEPNTEPDLAGYRVYRQLARPDGSPQGPLARLTALPIAVPAYRDVAVKPGQGYIYTVTAVDAAGNESAPSAKALESLSDVVSQ